MQSFRRKQADSRMFVLLVIAWEERLTKASVLSGFPKQIYSAQFQIGTGAFVYREIAKEESNTLTAKTGSACPFSLL